MSRLYSIGVMVGDYTTVCMYVQHLKEQAAAELPYVLQGRCVPIPLH